MLSLLVAVPTHGVVDPIRRTPIVVAVEKVSPAVVNISTEQVVERQASPFTGFDDPRFDEFFRDFFEPRLERYRQTSLGSGVLIRPDGYILTNQHVVLRGGQIKVTLADERDFAARLVGADSDSDLAVLKVDSAALPFVTMGNSDDLMIGETVIAIGNPFGLSHTVTTGVVSAVGRSLKTTDQTYYDFIQTDASINPGNSGGPLLNLTGDLVGVNTAIYQKGQGLGFAIPINRARRIVDDLITYGEVHVPWVGAVVQDVTQELAARLGLPRQKGVLVRRVEPGSPADDAGVRPADALTAIDGRTVGSTEEYEQRIRDHLETSDMRFALTRDGKSRQVTLHARAYPVERAEGLAWQLIGLRVNDSLRVTAVRGHSPASRLGFQPGDAIVAVAGASVNNLETFRKKLVQVRLAQSTLISVRRGAYLYHVTVPFADASAEG